MKRIPFYSIILSISLLLVGCRGAMLDKESDFQTLFPGIVFNNEIMLIENPVTENIGYIGSEVDLLLVNQSREIVTFLISEDVWIYTYSEKSQEWVVVHNKFEYNASEVKMYPSGTEQINDALVFVWPDIYDKDNPIELRIVAIGHKSINDNETIDVGAYFDIELVPFE